jgi:hypothetical protein
MVAIRSDAHRKRGFAQCAAHWVKDNALSLTMLCLFVGCLFADSATGLRSYNQQQASQGFAQIGYWKYLGTGSFIDGLFVNWQAAALQLTSLIIFSEFMSQRGASHSRKPDEEEGKGGSPQGGRGKSDQEQQQKQAQSSQQGEQQSKTQQQKSKGNPKQDEPGWKSTWLYRNSLSIAFILLFSGAFAVHIVYGAKAYNEQRALLHQPPVSTVQYLTSANLWSNTFQTWEAEFFVMWFFLIASIYLRQEYSSESKALGAGAGETGEPNE